MIKHEEVRKKLLVVTNYLAKLFEECPEEIGVLEDYINQSEATEKELDLYRKLIGLMVCVPQNETYHYVVRYTDDVKFSSILNQINNLSKVGNEI